MGRVLISTVYIFEPIIACATKISAEKLILLTDKNPDDTQQKSIELIKQSLGSVLEIKTVKTDIYDIVDVAKESVKIIDLLSDKDEIYVDITAGRKTKALGLLFGAYARSNRIRRILYVKEENKQIMNLPKLSYNLTSGQHRLVEYLADNKIHSMAEFAEKIELSRGMLYKHIKELKDMDIIEETKQGIVLTDFGKIVML